MLDETADFFGPQMFVTIRNSRSVVCNEIDSVLFLVESKGHRRLALI